MSVQRSEDLRLATPSQPYEQPDVQVRIAWLLACRYGDGTVYLPSGAPRQLLEACIELGYVSPDGFVTREGRMLVADAATG